MDGGDGLHNVNVLNAIQLFFFFFAVPRGLWDLSSPIGDRNQAPEVEAWSLNHWTLDRQGSPLDSFPKTVENWDESKFLC